MTPERLAPEAAGGVTALPLALPTSHNAGSATIARNLWGPPAHPPHFTGNIDGQRGSDLQRWAQPGATPWTAAFQAPWDFPGKSVGVGCHNLIISFPGAHGDLISLTPEESLPELPVVPLWKPHSGTAARDRKSVV